MSNQEVETPRVFLDAVERRFGKIGWDLAANASNAVVSGYYGEDSVNGNWDSLANDWDSLGGVADLLWLNPPFKTITPWAKKASETTQATIAMLAPASVCTRWFIEHVKPHAYVLELTPRVFKAEIRDCILALFTPEGYVGRETWDWK